MKRTEGDDGGLSWELKDANARLPIMPAVFKAWIYRRKFNKWPRPGGWHNQPLHLLNCLDAIDEALAAAEAFYNDDREKLPTIQQEAILHFAARLNNG